MKNHLILLLVFFSFGSAAQFTADAGKDTTICQSWQGTSSFTFGGSPAALGGTPPYTYTWECNYLYAIGSFSHLMTASYFIDDTTSANPVLIYSVSEPVTFYLTVEDATGAIATDSILVSTSVFGLHLGEWNFSLLAGDSVKIDFGPNVMGGMGPLEYLWQPNHGLIDSTSASLSWVKPTSSISYYVTITDSIGCEVTGAPFIHVGVGYAGLDNNISANKGSLFVYPNPTHGKLQLTEVATKYARVIIYDEQGREVAELVPLLNESIDISHLQNGKYTLVFSDGTEKVTQSIIKSN
jgi:hypothetical protein